jgi:serine/threonine protein kinase
MRDLVLQLLNKNPENRLKFSEIRNHPFFSDGGSIANPFANESSEDHFFEWPDL